eukprot:TRINITY_DN61493_c0_g1_i1.p1 TRINITY_DN61493_c0_g1~~TRINITY_DN61493_c0_g1_i1.p1  ORF type:complete len:289 (-),score=30.31 TRINITY_DN61493_c0_g1_i1:17-883(-)
MAETVFQVLLRHEGLLPIFTPLLGVLDTWRLRPLAGLADRAICPSQLPSLRAIWRNSSSGEISDLKETAETSSQPSLVDLVRAADPQSNGKERSRLLQAMGQRLLIDPQATLAPSAMGQTAVTWATDYGMDDFLELLLSRISDARETALNTVESNGWYPLFRATWSGRSRCAQLLLQARADPEGIQGAGRYSPLMSAAWWGHQDIVALLLAASADAARRNGFGEDALMLAKGQGHQNVLGILAQWSVSGLRKDSNSDRLTDSEWRVSQHTRRTLGHGWISLGTEFYVT